MLYALLAGLWWPAALIAVILAITGWHRTRTSANAYALLVETSTRLCARDLARRVSDGDAGRFDAQAGDRLTAALHTEPPLAAADETQATAG